MLDLDGLTRRFGELTALDGLSFSAAPGRMLGFVGPNGAGKTTAMRIVLGVLEPDAGAVRWRGGPIAAGTRARFGYMPEERGLYPKMRVRDQLVYFACLHGVGPADAATAADRWIERLGLSERAGPSRCACASTSTATAMGAWLAGVPGAELAAADARGLLVRLNGDGRPEALLDAARAVGTVTHFSLERPSLAELFRAAVAA